MKHEFVFESDSTGLYGWIFETESLAEMAESMIKVYRESLKQSPINIDKFIAYFGVVCRILKLDTQWTN